MPAGSLVRLLDSIKRALWRSANIPGDALAWRREVDGSIRLEIAIEAGRVADDVPRFDGSMPKTMGRST